MRATRLCVFGHANLDYIMRVPKLPEPNTSTQVQEQQRYFGGTGANIARWAAALGVPASLSAFVGEDFPQDFRDALAGSGVDLRDLKVKEGYLSPVCWTYSDPKHDQITIMNQGPMGDAAKFELEAGALKKADTIHICTGRPEYYLKAVELARKLGKRVSFDPGQELHYVYTAESFRAIFEKSQAFFCNKRELEVAMKHLNLAEPLQMLETVEMVVNTLGKDGSRIFTSGGEITIPALKAKAVVDTTGAGDAYRAGFYAGKHRKFSLERCGLAGAAAASYAVEVKGPQTRIPTWQMVEERMADG